MAKARRLTELLGLLGTARPEIGADVRSTPVGNYVVLFRYTRETLDLLAVIHASRDVVSHFDRD